MVQQNMNLPEVEPRAPLPTVHLGGVTIHAITEDGCCKHIVEESSAGNGGVVITPNLDHMRRVRLDESYRELVRSADVVVADGMPLVWACRIQKTPLPERVTGSNLISSLSAKAAEGGRSVYLLGGDPGTADAAADVLKRRHPEINIAGTDCPAFGFDRDERQMAELREKLRATQPDIVFVALGSPKQELLIERLRGEFPQVWWLGVGISFSFLSGEVQRAPGWLQRIGLEWLHRLAQEPRRLAKRYFVEGIPFAARLLGAAVVRRYSRSDSGSGANAG